MRITVPATALATAGRRWYRLDAVRASLTRTLAYGYLVVTDT
jgi:23S rRNA G2445 N2-methylase RlmL